jgi:hypothetical protein
MLHSMSYSVTRAALTLLLAFAATTGCVADEPTTAAADVTTLGAAEQARLTRWEQSELARVALERERSAAASDAFMAEWGRRGATSQASAPVVILCDPLPYASAVRTIGSAGGELRIGPHQLTIPAGALASPTVITGEAPVSSAVLVKLSPHGLQFAKQPTLMLSYKHCGRPASLIEKIVYVDDSLRLLEQLSSHDTAVGEVFARIWHFSNYAVAW